MGDSNPPKESLSNGISVVGRIPYRYLKIGHNPHSVLPNCGIFYQILLTWLLLTVFIPEHGKVRMATNSWRRASRPPLVHLSTSQSSGSNSAWVAESRPDRNYRLPGNFT